MSNKKECLNIINFYIKEWNKSKYDNYKLIVEDLKRIKCVVEELECQDKTQIQKY